MAFKRISAHLPHSANPWIQRDMKIGDMVYLRNRCGTSENNGALALIWSQYFTGEMVHNKRFSCMMDLLHKTYTCKEWVCVGGIHLFLQVEANSQGRARRVQKMDFGECENL